MRKRDDDVHVGCDGASLIEQPGPEAGGAVIFAVEQDENVPRDLLARLGCGEIDVPGEVPCVIEERTRLDANGHVRAQWCARRRVSCDPPQQALHCLLLAVTFDDRGDDRHGELPLISNNPNWLSERTSVTASGSGANWFWRSNSPGVNRCCRSISRPALSMRPILVSPSSFSTA